MNDVRVIISHMLRNYQTSVTHSALPITRLGPTAHNGVHAGEIDVVFRNYTVAQAIPGPELQLTFPKQTVN